MKPVTYKRHCRNCKWEDDVERKWSEKSFTRKEFFGTEMYECPECGKPSLSYSFYNEDGEYFYHANVMGFASLDPRLFKVIKENDNATN